MKNSINNQFKMRRHGGAVERATETSETPYSEAQGRTMAQMGMVDSSMNMGHSPTPYADTPALKPDDDEKPFNYKSDMGDYNPTITAYEGDAWVGTKANKPQSVGTEVSGRTEGTRGNNDQFFRGKVTGPAVSSKSEQSRRVKGGVYSS